MESQPRAAPMQFAKTVLIHNPASGDGHVSAEDLTTLLRRTGLTPFYQSSRIGELTAVLPEPTDLVVVAGGDGKVTSLWDVTGGIALVQAAGLDVQDFAKGGWRPLAARSRRHFPPGAAP